MVSLNKRDFDVIRASLEEQVSIQKKCTKDTFPEEDRENRFKTAKNVGITLENIMYKLKDMTPKRNKLVILAEDQIGITKRELHFLIKTLKLQAVNREDAEKIVIFEKLNEISTEEAFDSAIVELAEGE